MSHQNRLLIARSSLFAINGKGASDSTYSDLLAVKVEITPERLPCAFSLSAWAEAILVPREAASMNPHGRRTMAVAAAHPLLELIRITAHRAETHGIDRGDDAAPVILVHRIYKAAI
jgi:hypothetical protein